MGENGGSQQKAPMGTTTSSKTGEPQHLPTTIRGALGRNHTAVHPDPNPNLHALQKKADPNFVGPIENFWTASKWKRSGTPATTANTQLLQAHAAMQRSRYVIDPRHSRYMPFWDIAMLIAMLFTALVTPFEVVFVDSGRYISALWIVNRFVDFCFITDMILTFNLAYQERSDRGGHWVYSKSRIACHYLQSWFIIDIVSIFPFWSLTFAYNDPMGALAASAEDADPFLETAVLFRIIRLLRMLKLARVLKASRILQRHLLDVVTNYFELTYAVLELLKLFVLLIVWSHWQACLWGLVSGFMADLNIPNWLTTFREGFTEDTGHTAGPGDECARRVLSAQPQTLPPLAKLYLTSSQPAALARADSAALYWSIMTLTSIGYGEFTPVNTAERYLCSVYMMLSGVIWTYAIGSVASIATTLNPNVVLFHNTMDSLNIFMRERGLPGSMRITLREYFHNARRVHQVTDDSELLQRLSPLLQGTVALAANKRWLDHVWYFRSLGDSREGREFIASISKMLVIRAYVSHERLPIGQLYVLRRGLVVKLWRFLGCGKVWGEDMILDTPELMDHSQAVALTYVEAFTLRRNDLDECMAEFPSARKRVVKAARRITMQRALLKYLCEVVEGRPVRSFASRSTSRGFSEVRSELTVEQKLDILLRDRDERMYAERGKKSIGDIFHHAREEEEEDESGPMPLSAWESRVLGTPSPAPAAGLPAVRSPSAPSGAPSAGALSASADVRALATSMQAMSTRNEAAFNEIHKAHASLAAQMQSLAESMAEVGTQKA